MPSYAGPPVASRPGEVTSTLRLLVYLVLAIVLIALDSRGGWLSQVRMQANLLIQPIWAVAGLPGRIGSQVRDNAATHAQLVEETRDLRNQLLVANARLTRLQTAALDNAQLRELLNVAERRGLDVQLAPILNIDLDPTRQRLLLDAGSREGVVLGQAVIDAGGLMGQVIEVTPLHSTVLLLTDPDHAVPVSVARNGVRLIVYGRGDRLELRDIPLSAGVQVGDEIVTSGLGGRFPAGFPVGKVSELHPDDTHAFLVGELTPAAKLDRGRRKAVAGGAWNGEWGIGNWEWQQQQQQQQQRGACCCAGDRAGEQNAGHSDGRRFQCGDRCGTPAGCVIGRRDRSRRRTARAARAGICRAWRTAVRRGGIHPPGQRVRPSIHIGRERKPESRCPPSFTAGHAGDSDWTIGGK
ncbi:rod shape-determining protein MreC [Xanthomonas citri pv. malvacearum str. GSPB1386]|nr:rod shape-determining protein MreC [Xanthomonas citri pv. malvacearum str. GSPB1386]